MIRLAARSLVTRPALSALSAAALLTVALGAGSLASFARSTQADFVGDARSAWDTPYDLLVRPPGSQSSLERDAALVRPNFMAGIHGGVSVDQLTAIRQIAGVEVAAPIAMIGVVNWYSDITVPVPNDRPGVYRIKVTSTGEAGLSSYDVDQRYLVVAPTGAMWPTGDHLEAWGLARTGAPLDCSGDVQCFADNLCSDQPACTTQTPMPFIGAQTAYAAYDLFVIQPLVIAGIDPEAEAALNQVERCVVSGRYLDPSDVPVDLAKPEQDDREQIPVLASDHSFIDETFALTVSEAPDGKKAVFAGSTPASLTSWAPFDQRTFSVDQMYRDAVSVPEWVDPYAIYSAADVGYTVTGPRQVTPLEVSPNLNIYHLFQGVVGMDGPDALIPPAARDLAFRDVEAHADGYIEAPTSAYRLKNFKPVGRYDPSCIPGWNPLAGGKLDTYSYPSVTLSNGTQLTPTRSMSGYLNSPPLILTTLDSAAWLSDPQRFHGQAGSRFISAIRIRVAGTEQPTDEAEATLARVASAIHDRTGLVVDVVKGSSTTDVTVQLPAGRFGRPAETATEAWSAKGVVIRFVQAIEAQALAMAGVAFAVAAVFVATASYTSVRRRRGEFATLRALGWPPGRLAVLVELEVLIVGVLVATLVMALGVIAGRYLWPGAAANFGVSALIVLAVAATAGLIPALRTLQGTTAEALSGGGAVRAVSAPRSIRALAYREVRIQSRVESLLSVGMIGVGVLAIGAIVLIGTAFSGTLDLTILGQHFSAKAQPYHLVAAATIVALAALENGQLLMLSYVERRGQFGMLQALGWPRRAIGAMLGWQGAFLIFAGVAWGSLAVLGLALALGSPVIPAVVAAAAGGLSSGLAASVAVLVVMWQVRRGTALESLRGE